MAASAIPLSDIVSDPLPAEEYIALLVDHRRFGLLRRWDDLLDEGVAAVFGIIGAEAELVALCFRAMTFTTAEVAKWLAERGFVPLHLISNSGAERHL
jgi:hypothetical protein